MMHQVCEITRDVHNTDIIYMCIHMLNYIKVSMYNIYHTYIYHGRHCVIGVVGGTIYVVVVMVGSITGVLVGWCNGMRW